jgi:hypothetical protein
MKTIKLAVAAFLLAFSFQAAKAQVSIGVSIGTPPPPRRVVVVHEPVYDEVVYERPAYRRVVVAPAYPRRGYYRQPIVYRRPVMVHRGYYVRDHHGRRY